jgi:hypothetical protein
MSFKKSFGRNELIEVVNLPMLKYIVKNWDKYESLIVKNGENDYDYNPKNILQKYLAQYSKYTSIKYNKSSKYPSKLGRWFCKNGIGIQSMPRIIRHTLCDGLYIDLDFKNAHPKILERLCLNHNIKCEYLSNYINNRDTLLTEWGSIINHDKDEVKQIFLCALNGNTTKYVIPNWDNILQEFKIIHKSISSLAEYKTILKEVEDKERTNIYAKVVNRVLCMIENDCLTSLYKALDNKGFLQVEIDDNYYKVCDLIFDGLQIPLNDKTTAFCTEENFKILSSIIENDTGFHLDIAKKPFDTKLPIPENYEDEEDNEDIFIENDGDAAEHIVSKFNNYMINCNNVRYIKYGNIWVCDDKIIKSTIYGWIFKTSMKRYTVPPKFVFYNRDKTCINKCIDVIYENWFHFVPNNPTFISNMLINSKEYLPFMNGVYSMRHKKLMNYEDVSVQFTQIIDRDFPKYNQNAYDTMMEKIIIPILPDEEERQYFIYCIARALAGKYEDKKWFINKGSRNSGKGVITKLLQNAFKIFVGTFNSGSLTRKQNENADDAKNLSWVVKKKDCRLLISNEVQEDVILNGKMLKQLASGGDTMLGRCNYQDEIEFVPQFTMMLQLNNLKGVEPVDALESCEQFYCKSKFVREDELIEGQPFLKLKDDNIKTLIDKPEIIDAFTIYIVNHFSDYMETPEIVKCSTGDMLQDIPLTLEQIVLKHFCRSNDTNYKLFTDDIISNITDKTDFKGSVDLKLLSTIILKCNVGTRTANGNIRKSGKQGKGFSNIIFVE